MLIMSLLATPLALFDLLYVPTYWKPITLFNMPVGIEGFIFSFEIGGIAAAVYGALAHKALRKIRSYHSYISLPVLLSVLPITLLFNNYYPVNITVGIHVGLCIGILLMLLLRKDLLESIVYAALLFGAIYFVALLVWSNIYPATMFWFTFDNLPKIFIVNVPFYEITFGLLFGAYWGNLYELVFGYKYKTSPANRKAPRSK